ncbi:BTAD domain-containing putative transcriptional regulator [Guptibacillus algicola]|uniref:BTAD domain-containing putative transcriptional regulator n=1 Tax=Guptibacillus algicola TaxID=225844 RepID=UPI001CD4492E|nr:BTAD domain-containing putative transcriptional regulator [Alkalihalobacillus algicola]MCA0986968.1 transcriptional regulator [Alkalihalobacillus algicola]
MQPTVPIIETKLVPPALKDTYIYRRSVIKKLKEVMNVPLTLVHGGAGYGKSTIVSQFIKQCNIPVCWYTVTEHDDDIFPFIHYVVYSIRKKFPSFGEELLDVIANMDYWVSEEDLQLLSALFINECARTESEFVLVIDDFQLVDHVFMINQWIEKFLTLLPSNVHLLFSTRMKPKWDSLIKLSVSSRMLEISEKELSLSEEETGFFLTDFYESSITEEQVEKIHHLTEGWIIAINMIGSQLSRSEEIDSILKFTHTSMEELFSYLAQEVFNKQSEETRQFLLYSSIFRELEPEICNRILECPNAKEMLETLFAKNLFIQKVDECRYRYHALFKAFLKSRGVEQQEKRLRNLQYKWAHDLEENNCYEEAIVHYDELGDESSLARILLKTSDRLIRNRQLETLLEQLSSLSKDVKDERYPLWFYEGEVWRYRSYYDRAFTCYERAIELGKREDDSILLSKANEGIGNIYLDTIQPGKAERYLAEAIHFLERADPAHPDKERLFRLLAENLVNSGQAAKAMNWYERSEGNDSWISGNLDARLLLRTGKIFESRELLLTRNSSIEQLPQSHRETELLLSLLESLSGNEDRAKELAQQGIQQGIQHQSTFIEACGWIRMGHAVAISNHYEEKLAINCYETALELMESIKVERGKAEPLMGLCAMFGRNEMWERAKEYGEQALYETKRVKDEWLSTLIKLCIGQSAYYCGQHEEAEKWLLETYRSAQSCGDVYAEMLATMWLSFLTKDREDFTTYVRAFLQKVQIEEYEFIFVKKTTFGPKDLQQFMPLLLQAREAGVYASYITNLLDSWGYKHLESHPGYTLRIKTLGEFSVSLGDKVLDHKDWQREKGKELFQYLLVRRNTFVRKEEIFDDIWPEADESSSQRDFKVAFNALNKALEPDRKTRGQPYFVVRQDSSYGFNKTAVIDVDSFHFDHWITEGLKENRVLQSKKLLEKGLQYYEGEFLPDRRAPWAQRERERLRQLYVRGLEKLAQLSIRLSDFDKAIPLCRKIIEVDSLWEEAYRLLMYCYYQRNNRPQAMRLYHECVEKLREELAVDPMKATKQMYDMICSESVSFTI